MASIGQRESLRLKIQECLKTRPNNQNQFLRLKDTRSRQETGPRLDCTGRNITVPDPKPHLRVPHPPNEPPKAHPSTTKHMRLDDDPRPSFPDHPFKPEPLTTEPKLSRPPQQQPPLLDFKRQPVVSQKTSVEQCFSLKKCQSNSAQKPEESFQMRTKDKLKNTSFRFNLLDEIDPCTPISSGLELYKRLEPSVNTRPLLCSSDFKDNDSMQGRESQQGKVSSGFLGRFMLNNSQKKTKRNNDKGSFQTGSCFMNRSMHPRAELRVDEANDHNESVTTAQCLSRTGLLGRDRGAGPSKGLPIRPRERFTSLLQIDERAVESLGGDGAVNEGGDRSRPLLSGRDAQWD
jgi:hypothetical protein